MKKQLKTLITALGLLAGIVAPLSVATQASAATYDLFPTCTTTNSDSQICNGQKDQKLFGTGSIWSRIIDMFIFLIGAVSVVMIIVGGMRYTLSGGDSSAVNSAKNTIMYSIVGIVVAVMAYAIVHFIASKL
jgi:hypothetical protein